MIVPKKRGSGWRYQAFYNRNGGRKYIGTFSSRQEAKEAYEDYAATRRRIERGELPEDCEVSQCFREASEAWLKSLRNRNSRSAQGYHDRLRLYLWRHFGKLRLAEVTPARVMDFRDRMALRYAPSTVNGMLTCLSAVYTYFAKRQWVDRNPVRGIEYVEDPQCNYNWIRSKEEITRLLAVANDELRDMMAFALVAGLRLDELLHLQWPDVDLAKRLITVHRGRQGTVKSGKIRHIPILDSLLPVVQRRALQRGVTLLVFPGRDNNVRTKQGMRVIFKLALERAGLDTSLRWHDLRHTFASHWMMDGGDIFKLSRVLGHHDVKVTLRYAHLAPEAFESDYGRIAFRMPIGKADLAA